MLSERSQTQKTEISFKWLCRKGFLGGSEVKVSACNAGDLGSIPGSGRSPGEGNDNPLQYSCLENPMDRGAWWATVHRVAKSRTWLRWKTNHWWPRDGNWIVTDCSWTEEDFWGVMEILGWESLFLGRLIRSPGSPRRRKGSGALQKEKGVWGIKGKRTNIFFFTLLCLGQYNSVSCLKTCFSLTRTLWLIFLSWGTLRECVW